MKKAYELWQRSELVVKIPVEEGRPHRILLRSDGPLVLLNHNKWQVAQARAQHKLGGPLCRCIRILDAWRRRDSDVFEIPEELRVALRDRVYGAVTTRAFHRYLKTVRPGSCTDSGRRLSDHPADRISATLCRRLVEMGFRVCLGNPGYLAVELDEPYQFQVYGMAEGVSALQITIADDAAIWVQCPPQKVPTAAVAYRLGWTVFNETLRRRRTETDKRLEYFRALDLSYINDRCSIEVSSNQMMLSLQHEDGQPPSYEATRLLSRQVERIMRYDTNKKGLKWRSQTARGSV